MTSQLPIIAVDMDDVLADENNAAREFANNRYGFTHTPEDYLQPGPYWGYWEERQGVGLEEGARRYQEYMDSGVKANLAVQEGAIETINYLQKHYHLIVITSREVESMDTTHAWLDRHFPGIFQAVEFVANWGDKKHSKGMVCRELGAHYLIDDNPAHCEAALREGVKPLLYGTYGWSKGVELSSDIARAEDWAAVKEFFRRERGK